MKHLLLLLLIAGCTKIEAPVVAPKEYKADWSNKEWTNILIKALNENGKALLAAEPKDLKEYCQSEDKIQAYVAILSSMARYESGFNPQTKFLEPSVYDKNGDRVFSRGLLQISIESSNGYGCGFKTQQEIHDVEKHLNCVVKMAQRLILRDNLISAPGPKALGRYWSVLRYGHRNQKIDKIKSRSKELCGG